MLSELKIVTQLINFHVSFIVSEGYDNPSFAFTTCRAYKSNEFQSALGAFRALLVVRKEEEL